MWPSMCWEEFDNIDDQLFLCEDDLCTILSTLKDSGKRWEDVTTKDLLCTLQTNQLDKFTMKELGVVIKQLHEQFPNSMSSPLLPSSSDKFTLMKALSKLLGHQENPMYINQRQKTVRTLRSLCATALSKKTYPKLSLSVAIATYRYESEEQKWEKLSTAPMVVEVEGNLVEMFSRPEFCESRQKFEPSLIDPSHLLVNNRVRMLTKGISGLNPNAFTKICDTHPNIISRSLVVDILDKQNVAMAQRVFSVDMEQAMRDNGNIAEAKYTKLIREWYDAIDSPGIPAVQRIQQLLNFRNYLLQNVNFGKFPAPGMFIKGMSIVQFCGFIQNCETRIHMYSLSVKGTYNHRSIGTLAVESFFGDLTEMDPTGCPKAVKIPRMMTQVTEVNHYRHDAEHR